MSKQDTTYKSEYKFLHDWDDSNINLNGRTDKYSTGVADVDEYLSGGYGKDGDFEILVVYGETGSNKTTLSLNLLRDPIQKGKRVMMFMFENKYEQVKSVMRKICGDEHILGNNNVLTSVEQDTEWTLKSLADTIEAFFSAGCDVILVDHLQAVFEEALLERGDEQWNRQKIFMRMMKGVMKRPENEGKVLILVSHINKNANARGLNKVQGSHGIAEYATKMLEVGRTEMGQSFVHLTKNRHGSMPSTNEQHEIFWDYPNLIEDPDQIF